MKKVLKGMQGDVQFKAVALPKNANKISNKPIALGEHSGHCHAITGDAELFEHEGIIYATVGKDGAILQHIHESVLKNDFKTKKVLPVADHKPIHLSPNQTYVFGIHKKYNPFKKVFEKVQD